jgi:hypothetical protein
MWVHGLVVVVVVVCLGLEKRWRHFIHRGWDSFTAMACHWVQLLSEIFEVEHSSSIRKTPHLLIVLFCAFLYFFEEKHEKVKKAIS